MDDHGLQQLKTFLKKLQAMSGKVAERRRKAIKGEKYGAKSSKYRLRSNKVGKGYR
jgi:hypothetical protein